MTTTKTLPTEPTTPTLGPVAHGALSVRDIDVSIPWYTALTGAPPVLAEATGQFRHAVFALGQTLLGLHSFPEGIEELPFSPRRPGMDHVAFAAADRNELIAWERRLTEMVVPHGGIVDAHYGSALSFKDPDGL